MYFVQVTLYCCLLWTVYGYRGVTSNITPSVHDSATSYRSTEAVSSVVTGTFQDGITTDQPTTSSISSVFETSSRSSWKSSKSTANPQGPARTSWNSPLSEPTDHTGVPSSLRASVTNVKNIVSTTDPNTRPSTAGLLDNVGLKNVITKLFQDIITNGSNLQSLLNKQVITDILGNIFKDSNSTVFKQLINGITDDKVEELLSRIGGSTGSSLFNEEMQTFFLSQVIPTVIQESLKNKTTTNFIKSVITDIIFDQNLTAVLEGIYGNVSGPVAMVMDILPLVQHIGQLLNPTSLSSSDQCTADMAAYIQGVLSSQMWALQMFDASGKPGKSLLKGASYFLGNYDECYEVAEPMTNGTQQRTVRGLYWKLTFSLPTDFTKLMTANLPSGPQTIHWDLCLPSSCDRSTVTDAVNELPLHWIQVGLAEATSVSMGDWKEDASAIAAVVIMVLITTLTVAGTSYDIISEWLAQKSSSNEDGESEVEGHTNKAFVSDDGKRIRHVSVGISMIAMNGTRVYPPEELDSDDDIDDDDDVDEEDNRQSRGRDVDKRSKPRPSQQENSSNLSFGRQLLLSFSLHKNTEKILNTKTGEGNLGCIHGIRVLSMAWVILGHTFWWSQAIKYENPVDYYNTVTTFTMQGIIGGTLAVDSFFLLSGCLVCYLFLRETKRSRTGKPTLKQMVLYYVHRYWRLTPVYMIIIMLYTCLLRYLVDGPISDVKVASTMDTCRENWWINLLYINNLYKKSEACLSWSWFLADDMQYYVIAPLALLPIAFGIPAMGILVMVFLLAIHIISCGYIEYQLHGASPFINNSLGYMTRIYLTPWTRVGPFAIGLILGYILYKTKCKARIPRYGLVVGWQLCLAIGLLCTYITYDDWRDGHPDWPSKSVIVYETLYRPGWAIFVSWIIFVCCSGNGGVVNSVLSWGVWQPLGRLTYGAYLLHPVLLTYTEFSVRSLVYFNVVDTSYHFIGTFVLSYALSFITCVLVESPCMALEKAVLNRLRLKNT